jgi:hypothetical protein
VFLGTDFVLVAIFRGFPSSLKAFTADGMLSSDR